MGASRVVSRVQLAASYFIHVIVARLVAEVVAVPFNAPVVSKRRGQQVEKGRRLWLLHRSGSTYAMMFEQTARHFRLIAFSVARNSLGEGREARETPGRRITTEVIRAPLL